MSKLKAPEPEFYEFQKKPPSLLDELVQLLQRLLDYCLCCLTCGCYPGNGNGFQGDILETALTEEERVSVRNLLRYLDSGRALIRNCVNTFVFLCLHGRSIMTSLIPPPYILQMFNLLSTYLCHKHNIHTHNYKNNETNLPF